MKRFLSVMLVVVVCSGCATMSVNHKGRAASKTPYADALGWRLGMQAYSFRGYTFYEAIDKTAELGLKWIEGFPGQKLSAEYKDSKVDVNLTEEQIAGVKEKLRTAGVKMVNYGVVSLQNNEKECRKIFDFAKKMGVETLTAEPAPDAFDLVDRLCNEYKINVAIHNHPSPSHYWNPDTVLEVCKGRSKRIGSCADTGHWMRSGVDPLEALKKLEGRIISLHFKDLQEATATAHDVVWGTGKANVNLLLTELHRQRLHAMFAVEYEHNWETSMPEIAQCVEYFEKIAKELSTMKTGKSLGKIVAKAGSMKSLNAPVSVELQGLSKLPTAIRLEEIQGENRSVVPCQIEAGNPPRLWWILSGETPAGTGRTFELFKGDALDAQAPTVTDNATSLEIAVSGKKLLSYNYGYPPLADGVDPLYRRSGYIHPLWSPSGLMLTEDSPFDHLHHKAIWTAWTKTEFEGRHPDFWNLKANTGTVRFSGFDSKTDGPVFAGFRAKHEYVDLSAPTPKVALNEVWDVRVWNVDGDNGKYRLWDLAFTQSCATSSPLTLEKYLYGGLGFRGSVEWVDDKLSLMSSEGKTRKDGHGTRSKWCDMSGPVVQGFGGVTIMAHSQNFRFPEYMRIYKGRTFFCYAPPQGGQCSIEPGQPFSSRYRFLVHEGELDEGLVNTCWQDFSEPPTTQWSIS